MLLPPLTAGRIVRRYQRFLADVRLDDGTLVTAHCPNTGSMATCWAPGARVELSHSDKPHRKLRWTLERVDMGGGWIGVHTGRVNAVIAEGVAAGRLPELAGYRVIHREPAFRAHRHPPSRLDLLLREGPSADAYVEVKNTTLLHGDCVRFPDAVTARGRKHLHLLAAATRRGYRGAIVFAVNRPEGRWFEPAADIDPAYAHTLQRVARGGVQVIVVRLRHTATTLEVAGTRVWSPR